MKAEKTYSEKLKDPRWQRKRLEILNRDDFTCTQCFNDTKTLHVHHKFYIPGREAWEYENDELTTLCESCHEDEGEWKKGINSMLQQFYKKGFSTHKIYHMLAGIMDKGENRHEPFIIVEAIRALLSSTELTSIVLDCDGRFDGYIKAFNKNKNEEFSDMNV